MTNQEATALAELAACPNHRRGYWIVTFWERS